MYDQGHERGRRSCLYQEAADAGRCPPVCFRRRWRCRSCSTVFAPCAGGGPAQDSGRRLAHARQLRRWISIRPSAPAPRRGDGLGSRAVFLLRILMFNLARRCWSWRWRQRCWAANTTGVSAPWRVAVVRYLLWSRPSAMGNRYRAPPRHERCRQRGGGPFATPCRTYETVKSFGVDTGGAGLPAPRWRPAI